MDRKTLAWDKRQHILSARMIWTTKLTLTLCFWLMWREISARSKMRRGQKINDDFKNLREHVFDTQNKKLRVYGTVKMKELNDHRCVYSKDDSSKAEWYEVIRDERELSQSQNERKFASFITKITYWKLLQSFSSSSLFYHFYSQHIYD